MTRLRQAKVDGIADPRPRGRRPHRRRPRARPRLGLHLRPDRGRDPRSCATPGHAVARAHLRHLNPFPANLGKLLRDYDRVVVPEMNLGQLAMLLRAEFLVDVRSHTSVRGLPFSTVELADVISTTLEELS